MICFWALPHGVANLLEAMSRGGPVRYDLTKSLLGNLWKRAIRWWARTWRVLGLRRSVVVSRHFECSCTDDLGRGANAG